MRDQQVGIAHHLVEIRDRLTKVGKNAATHQKRLATQRMHHLGHRGRVVELDVGSYRVRFEACLGDQARVLARGHAPVLAVAPS